jgi:hypothetical protein
MGILYGRAGRVTTKNAGSRPGQVLSWNVQAAGASDSECAHYMIQPLAELYGGFMAVLKVSWCGILLGARGPRTAPAGLDEGILPFSLPHSRLYRESLLRTTNHSG